MQHNRKRILISTRLSSASGDAQFVCESVIRRKLRSKTWLPAAHVPPMPLTRALCGWIFSLCLIPFHSLPGAEAFHAERAGLYSWRRCISYCVGLCLCQLSGSIWFSAEVLDSNSFHFVAGMSGCPFARLSVKDAERPAEKPTSEPKNKENNSEVVEKERLNGEADVQAAKCPYGYDSGSFKIGPLSCIICRALLYDCSRCLPCEHIFCRGCITKFQDCVICGADIQGVKADDELQKMVDRFIEGHARIKRSVKTDGDSTDVESPRSNVVSYEDVSLARGSFLIQHAMRAFQAQNFESAKSRLTICAQDTREELSRGGMTVDVCSQLGAVLGMLGDCCRAMGDADGAITHYEESVEMLSKLSSKDDEVVHALSVSLNKLGDLKYYAQDLAAAHKYYLRALKLRQNVADLSKLTSQVLDVAVSLAKVADVNRAMGSNDAGRKGFQEAVKLLEGFSSESGEDGVILEKKRLSILEFLHQQLAV